MTPNHIARLRLRNQQIAHASFRTPGEVVAHLGAVQAQDFPGSKWAVGLRLPHTSRLAGATERDIEQAIAEDMDRTNEPGATPGKSSGQGAVVMPGAATLT